MTRTSPTTDSRSPLRPLVVGALAVASLCLLLLVNAGPARAVASPSQIDAYLFSKGSSLTGQGQAFYAAGQAYGVDPAFIVAITGAESSFGVLLYHSGADYATYNAWNWFYADPRSASDFVSWGEGATRVARGLAGGLYYGAGRYGVLDIAPVYCPEGTQNWVNNVTFFMIEMGADPADTRWAGATGAAAVPVASAQTRTRPTLALDGKVVVTAPRHSDGVLVAAFAVRNVGKRAGGWESVTLVLRRLKSRSEINVGPATPLTLAPDKGTTYRVTSTIPRAGTWTGTIWVRSGGRWWVLGRDPLFKVKVAARR